MGDILKAIHHPAVHLVERGKVGVGTDKAHFVGNLANVVIIQIGIGLFKELHKVVQVEDFLAIRSWDGVAIEVLPSFLFKERDERILVVAFHKVAVDAF